MIQIQKFARYLAAGGGELLNHHTSAALFPFPSFEPAARSVVRSGAKSRRARSKRYVSGPLSWIVALVISAGALFSLLLVAPPPVRAESPAPATPAQELEKLIIEPGGSAKPLEFRIEVARTPRQKAHGLMFRRSLPEMHGMLFPYGREQPITMWMKNTYIPLDMLFIKADGTIHRIEAMTEPFSLRIIESRGNVAAVLEIAGGEARRLGIEPGARVRHAAFKP